MNQWIFNLIPLVPLIFLLIFGDELDKKTQKPLGCTEVCYEITYS